MVENQTISVPGLIGMGWNWLSNEDGGKVVSHNLSLRKHFFQLSSFCIKKNTKQHKGLDPHEVD